MAPEEIFLPTQYKNIDLEDHWKFLKIKNDF